MSGEIICIGDELVSGRVPESNSHYILSRLWPVGLVARGVVTVGDDPEDITEVLERAIGRSQFILVSGGLGSTEDDITARVAAEVFHLPLTESQRMVKNLRACFEALGRELPEAARKMAWLPEGAEVLDGRCTGFRLSAPNGVPVYFLPGVPQEMRYLISRRVLPDLLKLFPPQDIVLLSTLKIFGLPEHEIGVRLAGLDKEVDGAAVGYYPNFPEVFVQITVRAESEALASGRLAELETEAVRRLKGFVVARGDDTLCEVVARGMVGRGLSLALAESCTGGLIGHLITSVAGSSAFFERGMVVYSNRAKEELLGVRPETLEAFGAVSSQVAGEMALGARERSGTDLGLAVTGIAGPDGGTPDKPVGTVWFGMADANRVKTGMMRFAGNRGEVKRQAAQTALDWLRRYLENDAFLRGA